MLLLLGVCSLTLRAHLYVPSTCDGNFAACFSLLHCSSFPCFCQPPFPYSFFPCLSCYGSGVAPAQAALMLGAR